MASSHGAAGDRCGRSSRLVARVPVWLCRSGGGIWRRCGAAAAGTAARRARDVAGSCREAACVLGNLGEDPRGGIA